MAKMLKQLVFGQKKNPPAPPRPDYEGNSMYNVFRNIFLKPNMLILPSDVFPSDVKLK